MYQDQARLDSIMSWLARTHGSVLNTALAVDQPAGMTPEWKAVLDAFGVAPISDQERAETVRMSTMTRGAPVMEVQLVLSALARNGTAALEQIEWPDDAVPRAQWDRLRTRLMDLVPDSLAAYKALVLAKRSMFAMAKASMKQPTATPAQQATISVILTCRNCGGPRLTDGKFTCDYCGTAF